MSHKKILIVACALAAFFLAAAAGFYASGLKAVNPKEDAAFVPAGVSLENEVPFSREFSQFHKATEPMRLPEEEFVTTKGKTTKVADFSGQPVLVNLWATWCAPCVVELPALKRLSEHYEGRLRVVGIALDPTKDEQGIADFLEKRSLGDFAAYLDKTGKFGGKLGIRGLPTSFLIGSDGLILYRFDGDADWTSAASKAFFDEFLTLDR